MSLLGLREYREQYTAENRNSPEIAQTRKLKGGLQLQKLLVPQKILRVLLRGQNL
jgi:hypothetical protein